MNITTKVIPTIAYCRTGKDTFLRILAGGKVFKQFRWRVYRSPNRSNASLTYKNGSTIYNRIAFADSLKREASDKYGIPLFIPDSDKDIKQFKHYKTGELVSARDIYIEWGKIRRAEDPDYWCRDALSSIKLIEDVAYVITDCRFTNEIDYTCKHFSDVVTVRLYCSDVPEPPLDIESEHNLDNYQTDLLLLPDEVEGEFDRAVKRFPQYQGYQPDELI